MTASAKQLQANRRNATRSTGPTSAGGKAKVSGNALKHGILSQRVLLDHESPEDFQALVGALHGDLRPVGTVEHLLVDRIAVTLWRQRRLVGAETAVIQREHLTDCFQDRLCSQLPGPIRHRFKAELLDPPDEGETQSSRDLLAELDSHTNPQALMDDPKSLLFRFAAQIAEDEGCTVQGVVDDAEGPDGFVYFARQCCRENLDHAAWHSTVKVIADLLRAEISIPGGISREKLSRYQISLDNQLYRALKELRVAQEWRMRSLEGEVQTAAETAPQGD